MLYIQLSESLIPLYMNTRFLSYKGTYFSPNLKIKKQKTIIISGIPTPLLVGMPLIIIVFSVSRLMLIFNV